MKGVLSSSKLIQSRRKMQNFSTQLPNGRRSTVTPMLMIALDKDTSAYKSPNQAKGFTNYNTSTLNLNLDKNKEEFRPEHYAREGITKDEIIEFKDAFDLFDTNGGGSIDPQEMIDAMRDLAVPMNQELILDFLRLKSDDGETLGEMSFEDMIDMMTVKNQDESREELLEVFNLFDVDEKGYIDLESLAKVANMMGETVEEGDLEEMIAKADRLGEGKIYFADFEYLIKYVD